VSRARHVPRDNQRSIGLYNVTEREVLGEERRGAKLPAMSIDPARWQELRPLASRLYLDDDLELVVGTLLPRSVEVKERLL